MKMNYKHGFSYTFERVQENSEKLWRFERYTVINDYEWRIPSPINIAFLPYRFFCCPMRKRGCLNICRGKSKWLCCFHNIQLYIHGLSQNWLKMCYICYLWDIFRYKPTTILIVTQHNTIWCCYFFLENK